LIQLAKRYGELERGKQENNKKSEKFTFYKCHAAGDCLTDCTLPRYLKCSLPGGIVIDCESEANNTCILKYGSVVITCNFATHIATGSVMMLGKKLQFCKTCTSGRFSL